MSEFTQLLEQEIPRLRRYARALTRNVESADDLVQSCLMRAIAKQLLWQRASNLRLWLFTILHNLHINDIRRSVREQNSADAAAASVAIRQSQPDACLELIDLDRAVGRLPERQRQLILMIGLEGMRYDQAAAIFGVPIGTIRSRIGRARDRLRKLLRDEKRPVERHSIQGVPPVPRRRCVRRAIDKLRTRRCEDDDLPYPARSATAAAPAAGRRSLAPSSPRAA